MRIIRRHPVIVSTLAVAILGVATTTAAAAPSHHTSRTRYEARSRYPRPRPYPSVSPTAPTSRPTTPAGPTSTPTSTPSTTTPTTPTPTSSSTAPAVPPTPTPTSPSATPTTTASSSAPPASQGPAGIAGTWKAIFNDDFSTESALDTSKWSTGWLASGITPSVNGAEAECYDPQQVSVSGGALNLTAIQKTETCGSTKSYASGMVNTNGKFQFTYGAFEARIYLPAASGGSIANWPAFWADGQSWPTDGETDVLEGLGGQACYHFHSPSGGPGGCASGSFSGWHTYAADWEPGSVTYYYDGVQVGKITSGITSAPQYLILNNAVGAYGGATVAPADMKVGYVRVWQH